MTVVIIGIAERTLCNDVLLNGNEQPSQSMEPFAIVPYVEPVPLQSIPPLDMVDISSSSTQSPLFNWWDYLEAMSDDTSSTATDTSTARSFNFEVSTLKGVRRLNSRRYKGCVSLVKAAVYLSSTASNSPLKKPSKK